MESHVFKTFRRESPRFGESNDISSNDKTVQIKNIAYAGLQPIVEEQHPKVVGFTKYNAKADCCVICGSSTGCCCRKVCGRKPAQICKPLKTLCRPRPKRCTKMDSGLICDLYKCDSNTDSVCNKASSFSSFCRAYKCCEMSGRQNKCPQDDACCDCFSPQCGMEADSSVDSLCDACPPECPPCFNPPPPCCNPACSPQAACCPNCEPPKPCPTNNVCMEEGTGLHCPWKKSCFEPLPPPCPKPPCLPLPPLIPKPTYDCSCNCNCEETDSDVEDGCANSIDQESKLAVFFKKKMEKLNSSLQDECKKVDETSKEVEDCLKEKQSLESKLCDKEKKVLETCRAVKKVECELMNIRNKICSSKLECFNEKEELFCPKVAIQYVRVLQSKLEKVRSGAMLKASLLVMCNDSKQRLQNYNLQLREDITIVQLIAKSIKQEIDNIKKAICFPEEANKRR